MNTDSLNRSQIVTMSRRVYAAINCLKENTFYEKRNKHAYLFDLQMRLDLLERDIWIDNNLCAYCQNHLDHNLGDHKLAVERQKVTNQLCSFINDFDFNADCSLCLSHKIHDISEHESALKRSMGEDWFYDVYVNS